MSAPAAVAGARMPPGAPVVAPSILSADFADLARAVALPDPAIDWLHCDVMDNHFVPNLTFGPIIVSAVRKLTRAWVDVHLMIERPETLIPRFCEAGADAVTVHCEAMAHAAVLDEIRGCGARAGLALRPGTPLAEAEQHLNALDLLLVMTVEPGFGGQAFMADVLPKIEAAARWRERHGGRFVIEVDGGIAPDTARRCRDAGADVFVAGHAIYRQPDPRAALEALRAAVR